ncbi:hypothetical protein SH1V18_32420 [Vallitalea longa]|uniref:Uncharacterized protein n=1 Tax=Vallitalea longa TaxID=2936439 RepID=A0A9W5YC44_9FIRM|nr:hypothetical protein [Vallitalea longa]GKX30762.1 hypothetical protein SH1V18_32420 [Vallitalea longa]
MNKYALVTIKTVEFYKNNQNYDIRKSWEITADKVFGKNTAGADKGCPKSTFLGLCEAGYVKGVKRGNYTRSEKNKKYGIDAVKILQETPQLANSNSCADNLWKSVAGDKQSNSQMEVVLALWNYNLIETNR